MTAGAGAHRRRCRRRTDTRGFTVAEAMLALLVLAVLAAAAWSFAGSATASVRRSLGWNRADLDAFLLLRMASVAVMEAGCCSAGGSVALEPASRSALGVSVDRNGDGDRDDPLERMAFATTRSGTTMTLRFGSAPAQPVLDGLARGGLRFRYLDRRGGEIGETGAPCFVRIELALERAAGWGRPGRSLRRWTLARLRNGACAR